MFALANKLPIKGCNINNWKVLASSIKKGISNDVNNKGASIVIPFSRGQTGKFVLDQPFHENAFLADPFLIQNLKRITPKEILNEIKPDLINFGKRVSSDIWNLGQECAINEPYLRQTTAWGKKVDHLVTCEAWKEQKRISAKEGLIAIAYERNFAEFSRLYQVVKLALYSPASGLYSCPLAMTDGAAKTLESHDLVSKYSDVFKHLITRDEEEFWTSGQWMTEKRGGSDVADATDTIAVSCDSADNFYHLYGYKWFSSATDSDIALTLARIAKQNGELSPGTKGLTMFLMKTRNEDNSLNGIEVVKLKNKLGTRQLPTAELLLDGAVAERISNVGRGIASISTMLTISRLHNIVFSVSGPRKILNLARDYAIRRKAFGGKISQHPLHLQTLSRMETEVRGCTALLLDLAYRMGLDDCNKINDMDSLLLRLMLPIGKMYTGKQAVLLTSEGLECFGGQGFIEDTGLPAFLRDAQVLPIWEGTSSVMCLDVLRAIRKSDGEALRVYKDRVEMICENGIQHADIKPHCEAILVALNGAVNFAVENSAKLEIAARDFTISLAQVYIAALLVEHATHCLALREDTKSAVITLRLWMERDLVPVLKQHGCGSYDLNQRVMGEYVYDGYDEDNLIEPTFIR
eukprot:gene11268-12448_t